MCDLMIYLNLLMVSVCIGNVFADFNLAIIHTNDVHARFEQTSKYGTECSESNAQKGKCYDGVARRASKIKELRKNVTNTILLDAGDQFQGTLWYSQYKGLAAAHFMNILQYDAMSLGNHEFDDGVGTLATFVENLTFPVVSSNLDISKESRLQGKVLKSTILEVSGQKIGIVGYTTEQTAEISNPGDTVTFDGVIAAVRTEVERLTADGVNKIIALGHAGYETDLKLAAEVPDIDIVVGGHSHTFLYTGTQPSNEKPEGDYPTVVKNSNGKNVPVVTAYRRGKYLGYIVLDFNASGNVVSWQGSPILLDNSTTQDPEVLADVKRYVKPINDFKQQVVGFTLTYIEGNTRLCRVAECNMGNFYTDALVWFYQPKTPAKDGWTTASIAIINSGELKRSMYKGNITMADLVTSFPYGNTMDIVTIKGEHLLEVLEHSASEFSLVDFFAGFLQVSGLKVEYNMKKPVGSRVASVLVLCARCDMPVYKPLNKTEEYRVITTNYLIGGGDGFTSLSDNVISKDGRGDDDITIFKAYVAKFSPLVKPVEGRIRFIEDKCDTSSADRPVVLYYNLAILLFLSMCLMHCVL